jgi:hypothetical protein
MNPFSGFLQPPAQRSPLEGAAGTVNDVLRLNLARQAQAQDVVQQKDSSARDWKRIGLQEAAQTRNFSEADKKEVEFLLAEYQDAEDQGDPVRLDRAAQMLKRFGMDVSPGQQKTSPRLPGQLLPDVKAFTGAPAQAEEPDLSQGDFEEKLINGGKTAGAYDDVEETELASREALKARNAQGEPDIAGHLKSVGPLKPLKLNTPEEQMAPGQMLPTVKRLQNGEDEPAVPLGQVDMDVEEEVAKDAVAQAPQLPGQLLPTVISKGGKQLYSSTGPSGRRSAMVQSVFEPFMAHENPQIAEAAKSAQAYADKLIHVDGVSPQDAIKAAADQMNKTAGLTVGLERTKLGTRPKWGGGGAAAPTMKDRKPFNDEMNRTYMQFKSEKLDEQFQGYNSGIGAISSANTASQYDALNRLIQARSGLTVSDKERAIYDNLAGMWNGVVKKFNLLSGGELPQEYRDQIKGLMSEARQAVIEEKERRAQAAANFYRAKTRGADPESVEQDAQAVADAIRMGAGGGGSPAASGDPNADLYQ